MVTKGRCPEEKNGMFRAQDCAMTRIISHGRAEGEEDTGANKKKGLHRGEARERRFWGRRESATQRGNGRGDWLFVSAAKSLGARGTRRGTFAGVMSNPLIPRLLFCPATLICTRGGERDERVQSIPVRCPCLIRHHIVGSLRNNYMLLRSYCHIEKHTCKEVAHEKQLCTVMSG